MYGSILANLKCNVRQQKSKTFMNKRTYHIINLCFVILVLGILLYSLLFRGNNHPIPALLTRLTGLVPPSKGLSASFSEIVRGNFISATLLNPNGIRVFSFFVIQLFLRILVSIFIKNEWIKISRVAIIDIVLTTALFAYCFAPLIAYTFKLFTHLF